MNKKSGYLQAFKAAFPHTIPILAGYGFLGITYGILMTTSGFPIWLPMVTSLIIYTGSMEFLMVEILASAFNPVSAFVTAIMVGARHLFYGISLLGTYRNMGLKKFYLIYTTSDETFSVVYTTPVPDGIDKGRFYFAVSLLDQMYWFLGSTIGALFGGLITFNTEGLDFVMTAMFVVILLNQWFKDGTSVKTMLRDHISELVGILGSVICLLIFGPDQFIIPTMIVIFAALTLLRPILDPGYAHRSIRKTGMSKQQSDGNTAKRRVHRTFSSHTQATKSSDTEASD